MKADAEPRCDEAHKNERGLAMIGKAAGHGDPDNAAIEARTIHTLPLRAHSAAIDVAFTPRHAKGLNEVSSKGLQACAPSSIDMSPCIT